MSKKPSREQRRKSNERELKKIAREGGAALRLMDAGGGAEASAALAPLAEPTSRAVPRVRSIARAKKPAHEPAREDATSPRAPAAPQKPKKGRGRGAIMLIIAALVGAATLFVYLEYRPVSPKKPEAQGETASPKPESLASRLAPTGPPIDSSPPTIVTAPPTPKPATVPAMTASPIASTRAAPAVIAKPDPATPAAVPAAAVAPKPVRAPAPAVPAAPATPKKTKGEDPYN